MLVPLLLASLAGAPSNPAGDTLVHRFFPVAGRSLRDVVSRFGAARDGGRRLHQGIDIAAPRGTPVLAVADGVVDRVEVTPIGGRVVWLRERGGARLDYYAHLDRILVRSGQPVHAGSALGTVGNTGNAATTEPHLHYGVHLGGRVVDPIAVLGGSSSPLESFAGAPASAHWARTRLQGAALKSAARDGITLATLDRHARVEVLGIAGRHARVRYHGSEGYIARWLLE